jgi:hypothetical protein
MSMTKVMRIDGVDWSGTASEQAVSAAVQALEAGSVLFLPGLRFAVQTPEALLFAPSLLGSSKNASYDPASGRLGGTTAAGRDAETLRGFMRRFSESAAALVGGLFLSLIHI